MRLDSRCYALFSVLLVLFSGCLGGTNQAVTTTSQASDPQPAGPAVLIAKAADIQPNTITKFDYRGEPGILVSFERSYYAYVNNCPHKNLQFNESSLSGDKLVCPFHKAQFDTKTGRYLGNADGGNFGITGLKTIRLKVEGGQIYAE